MQRFSGVWCATVTPLLDDLSVDVERLDRHVRSLLTDGCDGVALFGSTGEGNSFSVSEREAVVRGLADRGVPMNRILVGAGACSVADVVQLARTAGDAGSSGLLLLPPFYYRNATDDGLFAFVRQLVDDLGVSALPLVLYHFPKLAGVGWSRELIARLVEAFPQSIAGIKDSSGDLDRMVGLASDHPQVSVLAGTERLLLPLLLQGGAGCLTATTNLTAALARRVALHRREEDHVRLVEARAALESAPFVPGIKQLIADRTGHAGWARVRPPLSQLPSDAVSQLREAVASAPPDVSS